MDDRELWTVEMPFILSMASHEIRDMVPVFYYARSSRLIFSLRAAGTGTFTT